MTDFSRYLIASDIDGTYIAPDGSLVQRNLDAIARFRAGGGLFTISSGRIACTIHPNIPLIPETINAPAVLSNGALLYDFHTGKSSEETLLDESDCREILAFFAEHCKNAILQLSAREGMFFNGETESIHRYVAPSFPGTIFFSDTAEWPLTHVYKLVLRETPTRLAELRPLFYERFGDRFVLTTSGTRMLEVQHRSCNKANGIAKLRRALKNTDDRIVIACGDFDNDIEMLQAADISVCPANACDKIKAIADYQLCSCGEGLIADIIEHIENGTLVPRKKGARA